MLPVTLNPRLGAPVAFDPFTGPALSAFVPVSESQSEVWLAAQMGPEANLSFNEGLNLKLKGALNVSALHGALQTIVNRHEALRGVISPDGRWLSVLAELPLALPFTDVSAEADPAAALAAIERAEMAKGFDLETGPLVRTALIKTAAEQHHLLFIAHHVVCDGWSAAVVMTELGALYSAAVDGLSIELYEPARYGDYSLIEQRFLQSETGRANEAYWLAKLENAPPTVDLPTDRPRPVPRAYAADRIDHPFSAELVASLKRTSASQGASLVTIMLAGFAVLLNRLTGAEDVVIGLDSAGQSLHNQLKLVGHCVNKMPLRLKPRSAARFSDFLKEARNEVLDAQDHQGVTYGSLIPKLKLDRDESRPVLIAVTFNIDVRDDDISHSGLDVSYGTLVRQADNQELFINVVDNGRDLLLEASYNTALFDAESIRRLIAGYQTLLTAISQDVHQTISALALLTPDEQQQLVQGYNDTAVAADADLPIHRWVEQQAARTPEAIAVVSDIASLRYEELNRHANQLAHWLRAQGVSKDTPVALCMPRGPGALVAMLATLKAGGAYLPLDPEYPLERLQYLLADSQPIVLLTQFDKHSTLSEADRASFIGAARQHLDLAKDWAAQIAAQPADNLALEVTTDALAYVIYTSGTTGKPKGARLAHAGPVNQYRHYIEALHITAESRFLVFSSLAFDLTQRNLWAPLMAGGTVFLVSSPTYDAGEIVTQIERHRISHLCCTPSAFYPLLEEDAAAQGTRLASLREVALGGEAIQMPRLAAWRASVHCRANLTNCYGPTEASANVALFRLPHGEAAAGESLPIGQPIRNVTLHVLDAHGNVLPLGVPGELHIGGIQLARDYLNRPELTAERFIAHPTLGRLYRTGDRCRRNHQGLLEYQGRIDSQVKLRGFRVELGEIEAVLAQHPAVAECAAAVVERSPGDQRLAAYVVPAEGQTASSSELRAFLRPQLPEYMLPQQFVTLPRLPLTASGKLDRKALPSPFAAVRADEGKRAPASVAEKQLAAIWQEVLGLDGIGADDRFFDLGGHSLLAVQVAARIKAQFGARPPLRGLLMDPLSVIAASLAGSGDSAPKATAATAPTGTALPKPSAQLFSDITIPSRSPSSQQKPKSLIDKLFGN